MSPEYSTEYHIEGRFPESQRILLIGPRKKTFTTLIVHDKPIDENNPYDRICIGELEVDGKDIKGKIVFEKNSEGEPFKTRRELFDFLKEKYKLTYLRDKSEPAIITG